MILLQRPDCASIWLAVAQPDVAQVVGIVVDIIEGVAARHIHITLRRWKIVQDTLYILVPTQILGVGIDLSSARLVDHLLCDLLSQGVVNIGNKFIPGINPEDDPLGQVQVVVGDLLDALVPVRGHISIEIIIVIGCTGTIGTLAVPEPINAVGVVDNPDQLI